MTTVTNRRSRYKRSDRSNHAFYIGHKDHDIFELFRPGLFNYLTANLIAAANGRPLNRLQHRLRELYEHQYLERYHPPHMKIGGSQKIVYLLDKLGALELSEYLDQEIGPIKNFNPDSYHQHMDHHLLTNWFRVLAMTASRENPNLDFLYQYPDRHFQVEFELTLPGNKKKTLKINPDCVFGLRRANHPRPVANFFLEAQRPSRKAKESSTQQINTITRKLEAYYYFWKHRIYQKVPHEHYPEISNWSNMRVLILSETSQREHDNLMALARKIDEQGRGVKLFYFARSSDFDLTNPKTLLDSVWRTSVEGDALHSLLE